MEGDPAPDPAELRRAFDRAHEERYGYSDPDARLELVTVRVAVALPGAEPTPGAPGTGCREDRVEGPAGRRARPARRSSCPRAGTPHAERRTWW